MWSRVARRQLWRTKREVRGPPGKEAGVCLGRGWRETKGSKTPRRCLGPPQSCRQAAQLASGGPGPTSWCFLQQWSPAPLVPHELSGAAVMGRDALRNRSGSPHLGTCSFHGGATGLWGDHLVHATECESPSYLFPSLMDSL